MRRADRLFRIVQLLRAGRLATARSLAEKLEVSMRTIYRDVEDLQLSGVPIEGEAGVGYTLRRDFDIPPLMFDYDEIVALVLGARMVSSWAGPQLAESANSALRKIEAVLPADRRDQIDEVTMYSPGIRAPSATTLLLDTLRTAAAAKQLVAFSYQRADESVSARRVRPLALSFWAPAWTLTAWCEMRDDFRSFRVDRMSSVIVLEETFTLRPDQTLAEFLRRMRRSNVATES
jgi:predicted DNA-binding transcriptional regulator YafY